MNEIIRRDVPCGSCRACCVRDAIILHPEDGDVVEQYKTREVFHPFLKKRVHMLEHKPNGGGCIYLGPEGCTIHDRAPAICRGFDCRRLFLKFSRVERKRLLRSGSLDRDVMNAGRDRLSTLGDEA